MLQQIERSVMLEQYIYSERLQGIQNLINNEDYKIGLFDVTKGDDRSNYAEIVDDNLKGFIIEEEGEEITSKNANEIIQQQMINLSEYRCTKDYEDEHMYYRDYMDNLCIAEYDNQNLLMMVKSPMRGLLYALRNGSFAVGITPSVLCDIGISDSSIINNTMMTCSNVYNCTGHIVVLKMKVK